MEKVDRIILVSRDTREKLSYMKLKTKAKSYDEVIGKLLGGKK